MRFIPTHVGNAFCAPWKSSRSTVHPHARGERVWCDRPRRRRIRFIPTHVGNAGPSCPAPARTSVHPHARGERVTLNRAPTWVDGSSPRTWGTPANQIGVVEIRRLIPTHVGNANAAAQPDGAAAVHPHARGERAAVRIRHDAERAVHPHARGEREPLNPLRLPWIGSSPRTWGTHAVAQPAHGLGRFIPTHVGNASPRWNALSRAAVHPHARGERSCA